MAKILICTGIFPPQIGGPAQYAEEVRRAFRKHGHTVGVLTYGLEHKLPPLVRHKLFFWRTLTRLWGVDFILALDTFSVGWPAVWAARIARKKIIIRIGGDFLWEAYVERTGDKVLLKDFYATCVHGSSNNLSYKERFIFQATRRTLQSATCLVFSTTWQRDMWIPVYGLDPQKCFIVENFYGQKMSSHQMNPLSERKVFVAGTRPLVWKNIDRLKEAFEIAHRADQNLFLDTSTAPYGEFIEKIKNSYAVVLASLGDISPNMILDALRTNTPFILTRENGLTERIKDVAVFCDPENPRDIAEKIMWLANDAHYNEQKKKIQSFLFTHSWDEIAREIFDIAQKGVKK